MQLDQSHQLMCPANTSSGIVKASNACAAMSNINHVVRLPGHCQYMVRPGDLQGAIQLHTYRHPFQNLDYISILPDAKGRQTGLP